MVVKLSMRDFVNTMKTNESKYLFSEWKQGESSMDEVMNENYWDEWTNESLGIIRMRFLTKWIILIKEWNQLWSNSICWYLIMK